jgi:hypothetical protein
MFIKMYYIIYMSLIDHLRDYLLFAFIGQSYFNLFYKSQFYFQISIDHDL